MTSIQSQIVVSVVHLVEWLHPIYAVIVRKPSRMPEAWASSAILPEEQYLFIFTHTYGVHPHPEPPERQIDVAARVVASGPLGLIISRHENEADSEEG